MVLTEILELIGELLWFPTRNLLGNGVANALIIYSFFLSPDNYLTINKKNEKVIKFAKFTYLFSLVLIGLTYFLLTSNNKNIQIFASFLDVVRFRYFELFTIFWTILIIISVINIFRNIEKLLFPIISKLKKNFKIESIRKILMVVFSILMAFIYVISIPNIYYSNNYPDDSEMDCIIVAGSYFETNPLNEPTQIGIVQIDQDWSYVFLNEDDLELYHFNRSKSFDNYTYFKSLFMGTNLDYILLNITFISPFKTEILDDFTIIYQNPGYIFAKKTFI